MTDPCEQRDKIEAITGKMQAMEVRQVEIQGDVKHIKTRIDNGMSHTIASLNALLTKLEPIINHHARIIGKIEDIGWWISKAVVTFLVAALIGLAVWAIASGWRPGS